MDFQLAYSGVEGDLSGTLTCNGVVIAQADGFNDRRAVAKWADKWARDYKVNNTPETTHVHEITGSKTFTL